MRPALWAAAAAVAVAGGVGIAASAGDDDADAPRALPAPPEPAVVRGCDSRGEPSGRPTPGAVRIGPLALPGGFDRSPPSTFASRADQVGFRRYLRGRRGRALPAAERRRLARLAPVHHSVLKFPVLVRAGTRVRLAVAPTDRSHAALLFEHDRGRQIGHYWSHRVSDGSPVVAFEACAAAEPRFSGRGSVGRYTGFPGAAIVAGARCVSFQVWLEGRERPLERAVPFGVNDCPPLARDR